MRTPGHAARLLLLLLAGVAPDLLPGVAGDDCAVAGALTCTPAGQVCVDTDPRAGGWECHCVAPLVGIQHEGVALCSFYPAALTASPGARRQNAGAADDDSDTTRLVIIVVAAVLGVLCLVLVGVAYCFFTRGGGGGGERAPGADVKSDETLREGLLGGSGDVANGTGDAQAAAGPQAYPVTMDDAPPLPAGPAAGGEPGARGAMNATPSTDALNPEEMSLMDRVQRLLTTLNAMEKRADALPDAENSHGGAGELTAPPGGRRYLPDALYETATPTYEYRYKTVDPVPFSQQAQEHLTETGVYPAYAAGGYPETVLGGGGGGVHAPAYASPTPAGRGGHAPSAPQPMSAVHHAQPPGFDDDAPRVPVLQMRSGRVVDVTDPTPVIVHGAGGKLHVTEVEV